MDKTNKVALLILDGWGKGEENHTNAIYKANTPFIDSLNHYPHSQLLTHGINVGLPEGQMGNSEVGHINIGAGRIVFQELQRINHTIANQELIQKDEFKQLIRTANKNNKTVHLLGLVSDGGVHSHINHFSGIVDALVEEQVTNLKIHAFTDGRDTDPNSGLGFLKDLEERFVGKDAEIVSVIGRYYAMDRDNRWERTKLAYDLLVNGKGKKERDVLEGIQQSYDEGITDEFILPIVKVDENNEPVTTIQQGDVVLFVNFRTDRPRQLTTALTQKAFPEYNMHPLHLSFYTMTNYDKNFQNIHIIFKKQNVTQTLGETISEAGKSQLRIAETEKYPHVTFFFNGGREVEFDGEKRILINSPKVATYDLQPEMSAPEITAAVLDELNTEGPDFICLNFANADMVGHTGDFEAAIKACETVDHSVKQIVQKGLENGYQFLITADHGNSDFMVNEDGSPNTAHTTNPVPLFYVSKDAKETVQLSDGVLADLAPTVLYLLNIRKPEEMTGKILISEV